MHVRPGNSEDWRPTADLRTLRRRARLLQRLRRFFDDRGYWEVETPLLSADICIDAWIDPVDVADPRDPRRRLFLQTSPEFAMKRLLCAGADAIYQVTRSFRRGEAGPRHNLEFTIAEWYRAGDSFGEQMSLVEALVRDVAACDVGIAAPTLPADPFRRLTYDEAFLAATGETILDKSGTQTRGIAQKHNVSVPASLSDEDLDGWRNLLLAELVEPHLGDSPTFLYDYPASQAALARLRPGPPAVAERFELYLGGLEVCNGYQELTDPDELNRRMERHNELRIAAGHPSLPVDSRLVEAMRHGLPECSGVALGFDRLVMWRLRLPQIESVCSFPLDRS